ncbi:MAG: lanthionine synthetase LanC family protein [Bdellovibrionota bacterium]
MKSRIQQRLQSSKRRFDALVQSGQPIPTHELGPLSLFYLWWSIETKEPSSFENALTLRDLAAATLVGVTTPFSSVDSPFANHVSLKLWEEIGEPSSIWLAHNEQAIQDLEFASRPLMKQKRNSEYLYGVSGIGFIALQLDAHKLIRLVVDYLESDLVESEFGMISPVSLKVKEAWKGKIEGHHAGVGHGASGPLLVLKYFSRIGPPNRRLETLIATLTESICNLAENESTPSPAVWCSGSLGIGHALLTPSKVPVTTRAKRVGMKIFRNGIDSSAHLPADPSFCHGWAGVAQTAHRIQRLKAESVIERILKMEAPTGSPEILLGELGIALTLMSAVSKFDLKWDRHLLLSN